jgi:uncharacterized membrane protein (Fun14 family)
MTHFEFRLPGILTKHDLTVGLCKRRSAAVGAGIFFAALMYLESQNIVNINWDKFQIASQNAVSTLANAAGQFPITSTTISSSNFALPMTGTAALGFAVGFMKS